MLINTLFVYDELLHVDIRNTLRIEPISEVIAEAEGKLYKMADTYIAMRDKDTKRRYNRKIYGALLTFKDEEMIHVLSSLDQFKGSSLSRIGKNHEDDLCLRFSTVVYPITFTSIHQFKEYEYKYLPGRRCYMYFGNRQNNFIKDKMSRDRHGRIHDGLYKDGFIELLNRKGYDLTK